MPAVVRAGRVGGEVLGIRTDTAAFRRDKRLDDTFRSIDRPARSRPPTQPLNFRRDAYTTGGGYFCFRSIEAGFISVLCGFYLMTPRWSRRLCSRGADSWSSAMTHGSVTGGRPHRESECTFPIFPMGTHWNRRSSIHT